MSIDDKPATYRTVRAALVAARRATKEDSGPYAGCGFYDLTPDGRSNVKVVVADASDGGLLLGVYRYRVMLRGIESKWRAL